MRIEETAPISKLKTWKVLDRIGAAKVAHPEIAETDLNPVVVHADGEGAVALDALIVAR